MRNDCIIDFMKTNEQEIAELKDTIAKLESDIAILKGQRKDSDKRFSDEVEKFLALVANSPGICHSKIVARFDLAKAKGDWIFDELSTHEFIKIGLNIPGGDHTLYATPKGRSYLKKVG